MAKPSDIIPAERVYNPEAHYQRILALYRNYPIICENARERFALKVVREALGKAGKSFHDVSDDLVVVMVSTIETTLDEDHFTYYAPPTKHLYRAYLQDHETHLSPDRLECAKQLLSELFAIFIRAFPPEFLNWDYSHIDTGVPLISLLPHPDELVGALCADLISCSIPRGDEKHSVFPETSKRLTDNILRANGLTREALETSRKTIKFPDAFKLEAVEYVDTFLSDTAFQFLFKVGVVIAEPVMSPIPEALKFEHTWCLAAPGAGKTTLILKEIVDNLRRDHPPAMVILDPKGTITPEISRLAVFDPTTGKHKDKLIIVDPTDVTSPPAINMFHPGNDRRFRTYSETERRRVENQTIDLFAYVFQSRGQMLTAQQSTTFNYLVRLMFSIEGANIHTFLDVINDQLYDKAPSVDKSPWKHVIDQQAPITQRWFRDQYFTHLMDTRKGVSTRLYGILERPELEAMFSARERKLDMFEALQTGKTILVNVPKVFLGREGMELFGRYIIALTLAAAFERITIPDRRRWHPALLYIDEFQEFADDHKSAELLQLAREFKLGLFAAHQDISSQLSDSLKSALATNTSIKYVSTLGSIDAAFMAREMRCDPDFFRGTEHSDTHGRFACYARGLTPSAMIVEFPFGAIATEPRMPAAQYEHLLQQNRALLAERPAAHTPVASSMPAVPTTPPAPTPPPSPTGDPGEPSPTW